MTIANKPLNWEAITLEEAETSIREIVKDDYLSRVPKAVTDAKVRKVIDRAISKIKIKDLANAGKRSLLNFYFRQYQEISQLRGQNLLVLLAILRLTDRGNKYVKNMPLSRAKSIMESNEAELNYNFGGKAVNLYGVPNQEFSKKYFDERVKPVFERLLKQFPLDPDDVTRRNSLRNRSEREVRYWRNEALMYKNTNREYYQIARNTAIDANKEYIAFSKDNSRAYYPSRTQIF